MDNETCQKYLDKFFSKDIYSHLDKPCAKDVLNSLTSIERAHSASENESEKELIKYEVGIYSQISSLSFLALYCFENDSPPRY